MIMKKVQKPLDTLSRKRGRGRPPRVGPSEVRGRADHYRSILDQVWDRVWPRLSQARTDQEVIDAFLESAKPYAQNFVPSLAKLIFRVLREPKFPKRRETQVNFLADSLAGLGTVAPRSSRDLCERERARAKRAHHIVRWEVYVECSCEFTGQSHNRACPKCGAEIDFGLASALSGLSR
jgi:hypothetical protein